MHRFTLANSADAQAISDLLNSAYRGEGAKAGWTTEADLVDGLRTTPTEILSLIQETQSYFLLSKEGDECLACVHMKVVNSQTLYFGMLAVKPTLQARGTGKQLIREVESFATSKGCKTIKLSVIHLRPELIAYYERLGYALTGNETPFPLHELIKVPEIRLLEMQKTI